jgi:hypothetical protein
MGDSAVSEPSVPISLTGRKRRAPEAFYRAARARSVPDAAAEEMAEFYRAMDPRPSVEDFFFSMLAEWEYELLLDGEQLEQDVKAWPGFLAVLRAGLDLEYLKALDVNYIASRMRPFISFGYEDAIELYQAGIPAATAQKLQQAGMPNVGVLLAVYRGEIPAEYAVVM